MNGAGALLADRRKTLDMTQTDVADRLGTSRANYSHMETQRASQDHLALLQKACDVLDIDPLEMCLALGFKVRLPEGIRDLEESRLLERWRNLDPESKTFLRRGLGL